MALPVPSLSVISKDSKFSLQNSVLLAAKTSNEDIYNSFILDKSVKHTDKFNFDQKF